MKTKQSKEEPEKPIDEETVSEPKTRGRKKASDGNEDDKTRTAQDEPKTSKDPKKNLTKPKAIVKKRPLGIKKTLRNKKVIVTKEKLKNVIKQGAKRGRKPAVKPAIPLQEIKKEEETVPLIPVSEIKTEPLDEVTSTSRSSSPKTASRRVRLTSDIVMMKSVLADIPSPLVHGTRTSPYPMRSERSNSPSTIVSEAKNLRTLKPRKAKTNLLNEVVMKAQHKRRRLLSDSKASELQVGEEKKVKRGRSCSRDGSEISKCSDITESDISLSETPSTDAETKEINKKLDKSKTDLDVDIENSLQISTIEKVPSLNVDSKTDSKQDPESTSTVNVKNKKKVSLKRSSFIDSDNNNSSRVIETLNNTYEDKASLLLRTENDTLINDRFSILSCMSKTFNSREVSKNIRKARRGKGKKAMIMSRRASAGAKPAPTSTVTGETMEDDKIESIDSLSKEISDLITNLDQSIDNSCITENNESSENNEATENASADPMTKSVSKFYGLSKPLCDNNTIMSATDTKIKEKEQGTEVTPSKNDDSENIRLHYDEDSADKSVESRSDITYKCNSVASIDKLMDRLKEFEEFDKKRQRQESESKPNDEFNKQVMVSNDVVLINKSGADIRPLMDVQAVRSPEIPLEKENVLSCFENNSAISIVKRDHVRKSIDVDLPNSVTLIKRNSISRKESTGSNHSRESTDAISIFEKSLGRDVTLTEIRKSVEKPVSTVQVEIHQFATLHPNKPNLTTTLDTKQISITPFVTAEPKTNDVTKRGSRESSSRKCSETNEIDIEKIISVDKIIKSANIIKSPLLLSPVAVKSPETHQMKTEPLAPPLENITSTPEDFPMTTETAVTSEVTKTEETKIEVSAKTTDQTIPATLTTKIAAEIKETVIEQPIDIPVEDEMTKEENTPKPKNITKSKSIETAVSTKIEKETDAKTSRISEDVKPGKSPEKQDKPPENQEKSPEKQEKSPEKQERSPEKPRKTSTETKPGPSSAIIETPESQKRKESVLRTLGLLTHKAAKEAKIEKAKEKERLYGGMMTAKNKAKSGDYTGTLKTVIKLNRGERDRKKFRSSLKMTFKHRGKMSLGPGEQADNDDTYYTIERREGCASTTDGGQRKTHYSNRLNNHEPEPAVDPAAEGGKEATLNLVIPEKASSFSIHPGRLCMDQCFYCGGKFGLFDTPCHIAQMKSSDRQRKVLANEEKLTIDSCLCDACYRHVDRRANCPSYRKRPLKPPPSAATPAPTPTDGNSADRESDGEGPGLGPGAALGAGVGPGAALGAGVGPGAALGAGVGPGAALGAGVGPGAALGAGPGASTRAAICHTEDCTAAADRCIRRKWLIKMRSSVNKVLKLQGDYPGLHTIPLCSAHFARLAPLQACRLCTRRLTKHHNVHFIHHGYEELNPRLSALGIPVQFTERPVLCKPCRLYCGMLLRPVSASPSVTSVTPVTSVASAQPAHHHYTGRLLRIHNVEMPPQFLNETEDATAAAAAATAVDDPANKQKKKTKPKSKRKSTDPEKLEDKRERTSESSLDHDKKDDDELNQTVEDDIENLISSNKIMVPNAKSTDSNAHTQSDGSSSDTHMDVDTPHLPIDKQTELKYLLQKQNNPAQFLQKPTTNLTIKQKNVMKSMPGVQKPGLQHRIHDKNSKRIHKLGHIITQTEKLKKDDEEQSDQDKSKEGLAILKNLTLNEECTIESIPNKKSADINTLKNKWQMSESFTQVQKNLSQLSKKLTIEKTTKKPNDLKYSNPVKRLETNPSISVRELFPGEEEMNLQCIVEFNNVKGVTPEGWEKCTSTIQYDLETKRLWTELQRPYGNQSSFLRHLVLLEKYFRSGDLVLSQNPSTNAANYSDSVQSRLRAYDNVASDAPRRSEPSISLIEFRKQKPPVNGKSLLKTSQDKEKKPFLPPPLPKPKPKEKKSKPLPPELIAINTPNAQGRSAIQNVLHNIQQLVKGVSASDPTEVAAAPLPPPPPPPSAAPAVTAAAAASAPPRADKGAAKTETPKKTKTTSKPWRPTLMPITPENVARIAREPPQTAVDGRSLPSLVQVMSSGKRYHITLQDYNKMCIMRREKLQQLQEGEGKSQPETLVTEIHPSTMLGNGGTVTQNIDKKHDADKTNNDLGNAATILKNVGLKNITIAPIPAKTATVTSLTSPLPAVSSPSLVVTSTPLKLPQLGTAVSIIGDQAAAAAVVPSSLAQVTMPKIPKSLTVIPQTILLPPPSSAASILPAGASQDGHLP